MNYLRCISAQIGNNQKEHSRLKFYQFDLLQLKLTYQDKLKGTIMQIEKALINDCLRVSKIS